jgi:NitT/TauT family transport system substrate-binding protein
MASGKPTPLFRVVMFLVVGGLLGLGVWRFVGREGVTGATGLIAKDDIEAAGGMLAEAPDGQAATTVREYTYVAGERLPEVRGASAYKPMQDNTIVMALNVWAGWAPLIEANNGFEAGREWTAPGGGKFKLRLVLIDDPVAMRDAYVAGDVHIGWATLDMLPLMMEGLRRDSRTMPRVPMQIDFSNGGDGIVCREHVRTMSELAGKTLVLAQNSPSHFFALNALVNAGLQPGDVQWRFTQDAFQAAAAFNADRRLDCVVSWAPDIYNLAEARGNRMMVTTQTANKLIADVFFVRADFMKDHPQLIEGLVRGILDATERLRSQESKQRVAQLMATGYSMPVSDALSMLGDAHWTNFADNREFFLNANNPTNFERLWNTAYFLYRKIGVVGTPVAFDQVMDPTILQRVGREPRYANQTSTYRVSFAPTTASTIQAESPEILTATKRINFFPNSWDLRHEVTAPDGKKDLYDPNAANVIEEIGQLAGQYGTARIVIEGHTDASMQGQVPLSMVQELSLNRANAVKEAVLRRYPSLDPNQFATAGMGWTRPADAQDPANASKNRRVEVKVYPAEAVQ